MARAREKKPHELVVVPAGGGKYEIMEYVNGSRNDANTLVVRVNYDSAKAAERARLRLCGELGIEP